MTLTAFGFVGIKWNDSHKKYARSQDIRSVPAKDIPSGRWLAS